MDPFAWDESLNIGIEGVDRQHRLIFDDLRKMHEAIKRHEPKAAIMSALDRLRQDCETHFAEEDRLMLREDFPGIDDHIRHHGIFLSRIGDFRISFDVSDRAGMAEEVVAMKEWFAAHIIEYDKLYMEHSLT